jgi:hypothetical protein
MTSPTHLAGGTRPVEAEFLLPHEIDAALARRSVAYLPLGSIEYHSHHLPPHVLRPPSSARRPTPPPPGFILHGCRSHVVRAA